MELKITNSAGSYTVVQALGNQMLAVPSDGIYELKAAWRSTPAVDAEAGVIRGMVLAEAVKFKTGRGQFDLAALEEIARLINDAGGVPSYMSHDHAKGGGEGTLLGMITNAAVDHDPKPARVRADLTFDPAAALSPRGNWPPYIMALAQSNPKLISSSLVLQAKLEEVQPVKGRRQPPLLRPTRIVSADIVGRGDAVNSLLGEDEESPIVDRDPWVRRLLTARLNLVR